MMDNAQKVTISQVYQMNCFSQLSRLTFTLMDSCQVCWIVSICPYIFPLPLSTLICIPRRWLLQMYQKAFLSSGFWLCSHWQESRGQRRVRVCVSSGHISLQRPLFIDLSCQMLFWLFGIQAWLLALAFFPLRFRVLLYPFLSLLNLFIPL